jgi:hypothetical protein
MYRRRPGVPAARGVAHDPAPSAPILRGPRRRTHAVRLAAVDAENGRGSDYIRVTLAMTAATTDMAKALGTLVQVIADALAGMGQSDPGM